VIKPGLLCFIHLNKNIKKNPFKKLWYKSQYETMKRLICKLDGFFVGGGGGTVVELRASCLLGRCSTT
jgi:hypothetical protein